MNEQFAAPLSYSTDQRNDWTERTWYGLRGIVWLRIGILAVLLAALFWPNLRRLWFKTNPINGEANWGHAVFVPLIGIYYLYLNRDVLLARPAQAMTYLRWAALGAWLQLQLTVWGTLFFLWLYYPTPFEERLPCMIMAIALAAIAVVPGYLVVALTGRRARFWERSRRMLAACADTSHVWFGFYTLIWGLLFYAWSIWPGQNDFFKDCSMVACLFGLVLMLTSWSAMRIAWFPIFFLICAYPWPPLIYSKIAMPLQQLSASAGALTLRISGVDAMRNGTQIIIAGGQPLNVAEACAGIKSLMTFVTLSALVGFLSARPFWQKVTLTASAVPIAIFCNMMRVAGQGLLDHYWSHELSEGFAHMFVGLVMMIPAFFLILLTGWVLDHLFIEEVDENEQLPQQDSLVIEIPAVSRRTARTAPVVAPREAAPAAAASPGPTSPAANDLAEAARRLAGLRSGPTRPGRDKT